MSNINNLISKILSEAREKSEAILKTAHEEEERLIANRIQEAAVVEEETLIKADNEAKALRARIISNAQLMTRNRNLAAKQQVISEIFQNALQGLSDLPQEEYLTFIKNSIIKMPVSGNLDIILNQKSKSFVTTEFIDALNRELIEKSKEVKIKIKINANNGSFQGGFVLEKNGVEINSTFEALISSLRDELEHQVTSALFG